MELERMDSTQMDPLANLRDIQLPTPVSMFPLAPVWYVLMVIILIGLIIFTIWQVRLYYKRKKRETVHNILTDIMLNVDSEALNKINILLKRVAIEKFPAHQCHILYGEEWVKFLDKTGKTEDFTKGAGKLLGTPYINKVDTEDYTQLEIVVEKWLRKII